MKHLLDNPVWNALNSGNKELSNGNDQAKYFDPEVSPFLGLPESTPANFQHLNYVTPIDGPFGFITPVDVELPKPWKAVRHIKVLQMVCEHPLRDAWGEAEIVSMNLQHVPAMLALTKLTNPGPFLQRTIEMGHYQGIFSGKELIAMAGQRLHPAPYAEISAVCTHPDHLGNGYAARLILSQVNRIRAAAGIPFLHVLTGNKRAIDLYTSLGFVSRKEMSIYIIQKENARA
jgi:ribosomal protein S18 acetylase RimI-like enzyme